MIQPNRFGTVFFARTLPAHIQAIARRKLRMTDAAQRIDELRLLPANRLEKLSGDRNGQFSIRINDQWRVCLYWKDNKAEEVGDYH
ncbi:MAG: type II toxin-antitoxin system RelE/ParE family toxin [Burkholderiaceae bacterium]|nr:type II toxin-antitoxin system RelE/ParE family toxin [Burkholderiaceae bacterium]